MATEKKIVIIAGPDGARKTTFAVEFLLREPDCPDFLRLANALPALYPKGSEEKRLLDAMLLAMPK